MKPWDYLLAGLCAAWLLALFFIAEPEPELDWRVVAAFMQAFLSAGAIYSAWWLQARKREADRREAERDTVHTGLFAIAQAEWTAVGLLALRKSDNLHRANVMAAVQGIGNFLDILKRLNLGHFDEASRGDVLSILDYYGQLLAFLSARLAQEKADSVRIGPVYLSVYKMAYESNSALLSRHSIEPPHSRIAPIRLRKLDDPDDVFDGSRLSSVFLSDVPETSQSAGPPSEH